MRYHALATDYDGTLAHDGRVSKSTLAALERLRATGRHLILVTGRELDELLEIFPEIDLFEWVVAENGALLYRPATREETLVAAAPPAEFAQALRDRGVKRISIGRSIVATWQPYENLVLEVIKDLGFDLQVIFNKGAVMVLPAGVNKASGLLAALQRLGLSPHEVVGIGDAENDQAFLTICECSAATANALPSVKARVDLVMSHDHGAGVAELIQLLVDRDLQDAEERLVRHNLLLGTTPEGNEIGLPPYGRNLLVAGPSGSGKSTVATGLLERLAEHHYQFCVLDPEGDYDGLEAAITLGNPQRGPAADEVLAVLAKREQNVVVNLVGLPLADRPPFFLGLLSRISELRARTGRPHWLIIDEAHHLLPATWSPVTLTLPGDLKQSLFITVHPNQVAPSILESIGTLIAVGESPEETVKEFCEVLSITEPGNLPVLLEPGEVLFWERKLALEPSLVRVAPSRSLRRRHSRKYAEGELPPERSFYFRGPQARLNLRAQNLILFLQLADGIDDETWQFHLVREDYSRWFRTNIKNDELADDALHIEHRADLSAAESRRLIRECVLRYYTLPASTRLPMPGTDAEPVHREA